jgi:hypothetical protein
MDATLSSISLPESWRFYAASLGAMIALAGLDFIGAVFAKEWAERGRLPLFLLGWISFSVLFFVYARILKVAELSTVTIGWIVFLQVGLLALDALHYGVAMPRGKLLAVGVIIALQVYLVLAPNGDASEERAVTTSPPSFPTQVTGIQPEQIATNRSLPEESLLTEHAQSQPEQRDHLRRPLGPLPFRH